MAFIPSWDRRRRMSRSSPTARAGRIIRSGIASRLRALTGRGRCSTCSAGALLPALRPSCWTCKKHGWALLTVNVRKGKKARVAVIDRRAVDALRAWLPVREALGLNGRQPLFCSVANGAKTKGKREPGRPIDASYVRRLLPRLAERAGLDKRVHAHGLRHTHASELVRKHVGLDVIAGQLGHASVATTDRYLAKIAPADRVRAMREAGFTLD